MNVTAWRERNQLPAHPPVFPAKETNLEKRSLEHAKESRFPAAGGSAALFPGLLRVGG
jgi:hypothetical protein